MWGVVVDMTNPANNTYDAVGDFYQEIEAIIGTDGADSITGDALANQLLGGGGDDTLKGGLGNDTLEGGDAADLLIGGAGADWLDGLAGSDTVTFAYLTAGITINLNNSALSTGDAKFDYFSGIERLIATAYDDIIVDPGATSDFQTIEGGDGNDLFYASTPGNIAQPRFLGGAGDDQVYAFSEFNIQSDGGPGIDTVWGAPPTSRTSCQSTSSSAASMAMPTSCPLAVRASSSLPIRSWPAG